MVGRYPGRTTTVTVLFTDLVSSTQLMIRMGEIKFHELRQSHLSLLDQIITAHHGTEVKSLGDGVMAVFSAASDAVAAAVAMQQAVQRRNRQGSARLSMRVGLALGDATEYGGDWFGAPVVQAARICQQCQGNEILVADTVRAVAEARTVAPFTPAGMLILRGLGTEMAVWKLDWTQMASPAAVALPGPLQGSEPFGFVGRVAELAALRATLERAATGGRHVMLVGGEPGVGKSRLAREFAQEAHAAGTRVLFGRCDEGLAMPYQPFVEALFHYVHHAPDSELPKGLGGWGGELTRLVPELAELVPELPRPRRSDPDNELPGQLGSDPESERYRLFEAVASWLGAASADELMLVVLDDLHWATQPTLSLLRHVARASVPAHLMILGLYRDTEIEPARSLANLQADLRREPGLERFVLEGLDEAEVMALLEATGRPLSGDAGSLARTIRARTEGNPFFVGELVRHAIESGAFDREGNGFDRLSIPEGINEVVLRRTSQLTDTANQALLTGAVVGAEFDVAIITVVTGLHEEAVIESLEHAMEAGLVKELTGATLRFRFRHQLVRASLYGSLSTARRLHLHRRVGKAIETLHQSRLHEHLPALAHHFSEAAMAGEAATAIHYTWLAGDRASEQLAHEQAAELYAHALKLFDISDLTEDSTRRCDLLIALGEAQRRAAHPAHRQTLLEAAALAQTIGDIDRLAAAALANTRTIGPATTVDRERVAVLTAALEAIGDDDSSVRARLMAGLAGELFNGEWERRVELSEQAVTIARRLGDATTLANVLIPVLRTLRHPSTLAFRLGLTSELAGLAEQLGDATVAFSAAWYGFGAALEAGDMDLARRYLDRSARWADDLAQPALRWSVSVPRIALTTLAGSLGEAEHLAHQAVEIGIRAGYPDAQVFFAGQLVAMRIVQDRVAELEALTSKIVAHDQSLWAWHAVLALVYCKLGRVDTARQIFEKLAADDFASFPYNMVWLSGMAFSAEVCAELGDVPGAAVLTRILAPFADQFVTAGPVGCYGSVARYLGRLAATMGHHDQADAYFTAALAAHTRIGAPAWLARTQLDRAILLLTRQSYQDVDLARELLGRAVTTARKLALGALEKRARSFIDEAVRLRAPGRSARDPRPG
jgi:class 3 adenylate cyclase/tetratricopeptide (TPR) repeat protein